MISKEPVFSLRIDPEVKKDLIKIAAEEDRSLNSLIRCILKDFVSNNYL